MVFENFDGCAERPRLAGNGCPELGMIVPPCNNGLTTADKYLPPLELVIQKNESEPTTTDRFDINQATRLINDLGNTKFGAREHAQRSLEKMGPEVLPVLHEAAKSNSSPEVRARAERAIKVINCADLPDLLKRYEELGMQNEDLQKFAACIANWRGPNLFYDQAKVADVAKGLSEAVKNNTDLTPHVEKYHDLLTNYFCSGAGEKAGLGKLGTVMLLHSILTCELNRAGLDQNIVFLWDRSTPDQTGAIYQVKRNNRISEFGGVISSRDKRQFKEYK